MSENGFVLLSPRRLHPIIIEADAGADAAVSQEKSTVFEVALEPVAFAAATDEDSADASEATVHVDVALDAARIRCAAIGLAAAACARALRYAVDRNPRLLARFVDDALRAAGSPQHATVRLAPSAVMSGGDHGDQDYVADASLSPCDVFVDCADGTLGATIEQRAEGLVRAVSS